MRHTRRTAATLLLAAAAQAAIAQDQLLKLSPDNPSDRSWFGISAYTDGARAIVGAVGDDDNGSASGAAHIFDLATGNELVKLLPDDGEDPGWFGVAVALQGDLAIVGEFSDVTGHDGEGAVYVFDAVTGQQLAKLLPNDVTVTFGVDIAVEGDTLAIGAHDDFERAYRAGAVYIFDLATGQQRYKLFAPDATEQDQFGLSVDIHNGVVIVGAAFNDIAYNNSGSVYLFDAASGQLIDQWQSPDPATAQLFGRDVAIHGDTAIVGAAYDDTLGADAGTAYVFDVPTGQPLHKLLPDDGEAQDYFGFTLDYNGGLAVIGARYEDDLGANAGAAYLFDPSTGTQIAKLLAGDGAADDRFGRGVAIAGGIAVVGAYRHDLPYYDTGAAYVFSAASDCPADLNGDGQTDIQDFIVFLNAWAGSDPVADWNGDGAIDIQDFLAFLNDWSAGC